MEKRVEELLKLKSYTEVIDKDLTMILQSLQWDRKHILEHSTFVTCKYDYNHKVLLDRVENHEKICLLKQNGYRQEDIFLPEPLNPESNTLIKFSNEDIAVIVSNASKSCPNFKKGSGELAPQTLERLQATYSTDERRAIYEAAVSAAPACHDLTDLALASVGDDSKAPKTKSRVEILAELRDMRRRRTKYRVAAKSTNYSDVLRDVIKTQMEVYTEALGDTALSVNENNRINTTKLRTEHNNNANTKDDSRDRHECQRDISNREQNRKEKSDRDKRERRRDERRSRDRKHVERARERRRDDRDYIYKPSVEIKIEVKEEDDVRRDRSLETRNRNRSKDRTYNEKRDTSYRHKDRIYIKKEKPDSKMYQESSRERYDELHSRSTKNKKRRKDKSKERYYERVRELSDDTRARNLIVEIKREMESAERSEAEERKRDGCEIKNTKKHSDYISRNERHYYNEDFGHGSRQRDRNREDLDTDKDYGDDKRYKKRRHDESESRDSSRRGKHMRNEYYDRNKSKRDRRCDN